MLREISILYIYSVWTRGSESRFSLRFCEWPVQCQIRRQRAYPTTGVCGHSTRKIAKNWNSLGTFSSILAGKFYASIRLEKRCDVYFVEKLKQIQTAHTKRISCVLKLLILNDRLSLISWLLSSELAAIFGEAYYGSPMGGHICIHNRHLYMSVLKSLQYARASVIQNMVSAADLLKTSHRQAG